VNFPYPVVPIVRHHHERWDGHGYPDGLRGNEIPITARILSVVDCFDAVREDRQYRKGLSRVEACALLQNGSGTQFDPYVVDAFLEHLPSYEREIEQGKVMGYPQLGASTQPGLSESALLATPAAGLAPGTEVPGYLRQINAAHVEVAALYELAQSLAANHTAREVAELTVRHIERIIGFTTCVFYLCRESDDSLIAQYVFGENSDQIHGRRLAPGRGIAGWVVINDQPMTNVDPMLDLSHFIKNPGTRYRTGIVYPLPGTEQTLGAIAIYASDRAEYSKEQLQLVESFSRLASTALQTAFYYERTQNSAHRDPLTNLPNARSLYDSLGERLNEAKERGTQLTLIAFALSDVAAINDEFGYLCGDKLIAEAGRYLRSIVGDECFLSRVAGAKFVGILPGYSRGFAVEIGERARSEAQAVNIELRPGRVTHLPLFYGVADYQGSNQSLDDLLRTAVAAVSQKRHARRSDRSEWISNVPPFDTPYSN
jgi:diguanylate cyclase (GGDEF)-like protein